MKSSENNSKPKPVVTGDSFQGSVNRETLSGPKPTAK